MCLGALDMKCNREWSPSPRRNVMSEKWSGEVVRTRSRILTEVGCVISIEGTRGDQLPFGRLVLFASFVQGASVPNLTGLRFGTLRNPRQRSSDIRCWVPRLRSCSFVTVLADHWWHRTNRSSRMAWNCFSKLWHWFYETYKLHWPGRPCTNTPQVAPEDCDKGTRWSDASSD